MYQGGKLTESEIMIMESYTNIVCVSVGCRDDVLHLVKYIALGCQVFPASATDMGRNIKRGGRVLGCSFEHLYLTSMPTSSIG